MLYTSQAPILDLTGQHIKTKEDIKAAFHTLKERNASFIPQVDGIVDSRDSLDRTPDSVDLTESPVRHTKT